MSLDSTAEYGRIQKRMRKGTKSCLPCRRRKIRCSGQGNDGSSCPECRARNETCAAQGIVPEDAATVNIRLKDRVHQLERVLQRLAHERQSFDAVGKDINTPSAALQNLLTEIHENEDSMISDNDREEEEINTATAPLMRLLNSSVLGDTPGSSISGVGGETADNGSDARLERDCKSPRYITAVRELCACMPSEAEMSDVFENRSSWWALYRETLGLVWTDPDRDTLKSFALQALKSGHPTQIGLLLVSFAISTGDAQKYLPPVERHILHNDDWSGSEYGMNCLVALGLCYMSSLQPRRAWMVYRRAISLLQLNGLHIRRKSEKQELLFWQLFHADKWVSLMIGLPYMVPDHFCDVSVAPLARLGPAIWSYRKLGLMTSNVIDCLQAEKGPTLSAALQIEEQLEEILAQLPTGYLALGRIKECTDVTDKFTRLYRVVHYYQLMMYVHLPFLLRSSSQAKYEYSRKSCIDDSRRLVEAYLEIFDTSPSAAFDGLVLNFVAFTATIVVLLGLTGYGRSEGAQYSPPQTQMEHDWQIIYRIRSALDQGSQTQPAQLLCRKCFTALDSLILSALGQGDDSSQQVVIPYFGTLSFTHNSHRPSSTSTPYNANDNLPATMLAHTLPGSSNHSERTQTSQVPKASVPAPETTFAYNGPFMPESYHSMWMPDIAFGSQQMLDSGLSWYNDFDMNTDWSWLTADLPPNAAL